ncbi:MAG: peptidoglycan editing factor PgeF [Clostridia bacterium]|nr:peptidoglycan editing factor PgeF [Clostridia bacterium]
MFYERGLFSCSSFLDLPGVRHGFSSRTGGVSVQPHTASFNLSRGLGDDDAVVCRNLDIFAQSLTDGTYGGERTVTVHQIHSAKVRVLTDANAGEGFSLPCGEDCDGFVTDQPGIIPIARTADCVPVLLAGLKNDASPVIAAVHAGWKGTVSGICAAAVEKMLALGCTRESIRAAVGPHIGFCCYEVGEDFIESVAAVRGNDFALRHIRKNADMAKAHADLTSMNLEILADAGIAPECVDVHPACTMCAPDKYYSHRASGGKRGVMGGGICIL